MFLRWDKLVGIRYTAGKLKGFVLPSLFRIQVVACLPDRGLVERDSKKLEDDSVADPCVVPLQRGGVDVVFREVQLERRSSVPINNVRETCVVDLRVRRLLDILKEQQ